MQDTLYLSEHDHSHGSSTQLSRWSAPAHGLPTFKSSMSAPLDGPATLVPLTEIGLPSRVCCVDHLSLGRPGSHLLREKQERGRLFGEPDKEDARVRRERWQLGERHKQPPERGMAYDTLSVHPGTLCGALKVFLSHQFRVNRQQNPRTQVRPHSPLHDVVLADPLLYHSPLHNVVLGGLLRIVKRIGVPLQYAIDGPVLGGKHGPVGSRITQLSLQTSLLRILQDACIRKTAVTVLHFGLGNGCHLDKRDGLVKVSPQQAR